jgi:outer membrane protein assembly factor BamD
MPKKVKQSSIEFLNDVNQESMIKQASFFLASGKPSSAIEILESIRAIYPFTDASEWAMMNLLKIYNSEKKFLELILVADQFLDQIDANHKDAEYISFLYANAHFQKMGDKARNIEEIRDASEILEWFLEEFGNNSKYGKDIGKKLEITNGRLIFRELEIGYFYEKKGNFIAALKRYLDAYKFKGKNQYESEILYRIYYCYLNIGLQSDAMIFYEKLMQYPKNDKFVKLAMNIEALKNKKK